MSQENTKLCDFSNTNNNDFISTLIAPATSANSYEINAALLNLVMKEQFSGSPNEDAASHLNTFIELCDMQKKKYVDNDIVKLKLFSFSLRDRAKIWFSSLPRNSIDSWDKCKDAFITKYFLPSKIISLRTQIINFKQLEHEHVAQSWERMKMMLRNCPTHGLNLWMIIQKIYAGLNFVSRNLLDSAAGGTFMEITLGESTKFLDNIMANYSQWHIERAPTSKKVNSVEEISSLSEKVDALMKLVASKSAPIDFNDMPLSTLIEKNSDAIDVNLISRNNFNNNAYRGNFNPRPFPSNSSNNYGNSYGNPSYNNNRNTSDLENNIKEFINTQKVYNTTIEEKLNKIDDLGTEEESTLARRRLDNSEGENLAEKIDKSGFEEVKTLTSDVPTLLDYKDFNYDSCYLIDCISLLQSMINSPHAYEQNKAFTKHIVDAMMKAFEEKLELEVSIPRKLHDEWEPTIKVKIKNYECFALCDLGASVSTIPKSLCDVLGLTDIEECSLNLHLADSTIKKPMGRINDVLILANKNYVPIDFIVLDIDCNPSCPVILGRPFLRIIGAVIDMKEGNIKFQFPLRKGMEHFPRKRIKAPYESIMRATYGINLKDDNT